MNIDKSMKKCTIHSDSNCSYVKNKQETEHKGVGEIRRDGGWLSFPNIREAKDYYLSKYDRYTLIEHWVTISNP